MPVDITTLTPAANAFRIPIAFGPVETRPSGLVAKPVFTYDGHDLATATHIGWAGIDPEERAWKVVTPMPSHALAHAAFSTGDDAVKALIDWWTE